MAGYPTLQKIATIDDRPYARILVEEKDQMFLELRFLLAEREFLSKIVGIVAESLKFKWSFSGAIQHAGRLRETDEGKRLARLLVEYMGWERDKDAWFKRGIIPPKWEEKEDA